MIIVANSYILNTFKKIPLFKMNLGDSFISMKEEKIHIKDPFIIKYLNISGRQIFNYGNIGKLLFYQDPGLHNNEYYIFNDETIYGLKYTEDDTKLKPEDYLASIIKEINEKEGIRENSFKSDHTNKDPNISLPKDQYLQEMIKKRKLNNA